MKRARKGKGYLDIRPLKKFAAEKLRVGSVLREVLLAEEDKLPVEEFLAKQDVWLHLLNIEA